MSFWAHERCVVLEFRRRRSTVQASPAILNHLATTWPTTRYLLRLCAIPLLHPPGNTAMCISKPSTGKKNIVKTRSGRPVRAKQHLPSSLAIVLDPTPPAAPVKKSSTRNVAMRTSTRSAGRKKGGKQLLRTSSSITPVPSTTPTSSSRQSFPSQLHHMLDDAERKGFDDIVSWQPHGRCFVVHKVKEFVEQILPNYFRQSKFPSFQRQLNLYEFSRITQGKDRNAYYHDRFLRGMPDLSERMNRCKVKGTRVRHAPQPELEPDFYSYPPLSVKNSVSSSSTKKKNKKKPRRSSGLPKSSYATNRTDCIVKESMSKGLKISNSLPFVCNKSALVTPPDTPREQQGPHTFLAQSLLLDPNGTCIAAEESIGLTSAPPATRDDILAILGDAQDTTFSSVGAGQPPVLGQAPSVREAAVNDTSWPSLEWPERDESQDLSHHSTSTVTSTSGTDSCTGSSSVLSSEAPIGITNTSMQRVNSIIFFEGKPFHYMESDAIHIPLVCGHP